MKPSCHYKKLLCISTLTLLVITFNGYTQNTPLQKISMLNPAGDVKHPGRKFTNGYERAVTFRIAEQLQKGIEQKYNIRAVLTRMPGEEVIHLQNASFANRLKVSLFLHLAIYKEESSKPKIYIYHLVQDPVADFAHRTLPTLTFTPVNKAYLHSIHQTKTFGERMKLALSTHDNEALFDCCGVFGLPLKPLEGITQPALLIEIGANSEEKIAALIQPLIDSLKFITE